MENELLGNILNNIVMEKAVRDKIVMQQKEQRGKRPASAEKASGTSWTSLTTRKLGRS